MEHGGGMIHGATVMEVLSAALRAADPYAAVLDALHSEEARALTDAAAKIHIVGAGKAGAAMARAAEDALEERIAGGLVIVKERHTGRGGVGAPVIFANAPQRGPGAPEQGPRIQANAIQAAPMRHVSMVEAGHPVPDERGVEGTARLLEIADGADEGDLVLCLISGGGSALMVSPAEGLSLGDVQATTALLLRAGATINELNAVRKHLSRVAGGQLARRAAPARVLSLVLSDVIGSPLDVIASGPTAPDPTTYGNALRVIERYGLAEQIPSAVLTRLQAGAAGRIAETPKPGDPIFDNVTNRVVADNAIAVQAAARRAAEMGLNVLVMSTYIEGEAREVGTVLAGIAREVAAHARPVERPACLLFGGETTVTVRGSGVGGRNGEVALGAALALDGLGPDVLVASFATDGGDGTSPAAGAIADGTTIERSKRLGLDARAALANNDSYTFWQGLGDAITTGPTGTNVIDVMAVFVF